MSDSTVQRQSAHARNGIDVAIDLSAVVLTVADGEPRVLLAPAQPGAVGESDAALPAGPFTPARHRTLEEGLRDWVATQTGLRLGYVEQLYTFADRYRDPREMSGGPRRVSIGYLALVRSAPSGNAAVWRNVYDLLPWEDCRDGAPALLEAIIRPRLAEWAESGVDPTIRAARSERIAAAFGLGGSWPPEPVLERYELLYECELVAEARRDAWARALHAARALGADLPAAPPPANLDLGPPMLHDHRRILATGLSRLRGKLAYRPLVFELLPPTFTLSQLQTVVEALAGVRLHKQNFRRTVVDGGLVEPIGSTRRTGGRPAAQFRFRREVLRERPAPGIGLPVARSPGADRG